jgi:DNA-binding NarL/FixJ family response regulator
VTIRILLADDHPVVAEGLRSLIDAQGDMKVVALTGNGLGAVRSCLETKPDIVVMDQAMPEMNGTEAAEMIRSRRSSARVVMLSMHSNTEHVQRALQAGASGYVLKTSAVNELVDAIRVVHAGRRYLSRALADELLERIMGDARCGPLSVLSARERQVLKLVAEGNSLVRIAAQLSLSRKTVETYRGRMMVKLGIENLAGLIKFAIKQGVISLE